MQRIDAGHTYVTGPEMERIPYSKLQLLFELLERQNAGFSEFAEEVAQYPVVSRRILRAANAAAIGRNSVISDPTHAAAFLGSRRLIHLLQTTSVVDDEEEGVTVDDSKVAMTRQV